jgi:predicted metal-binding protein
MRCGANGVFTNGANAAAAPATVSGEPNTQATGVSPGKAWTVPTREPGDLPSIRSSARRGAWAAVVFMVAANLNVRSTPSRHPSARRSRRVAESFLQGSALQDSAGDAGPGVGRAQGASSTAADAGFEPSVVSAPECAITIYVCVTCRAGRPLDLVPVPGDVLAEATSRAAAGTGIIVRRVRCLANCNRGLSVAVRRDGAWTYVFGHLDPANAAADAASLVEGARLFARSPDGLMPWRGRPDVLKRGLVARTPPFDFAGEPG